jgi:hypothetical protein
MRDETILTPLPHAPDDYLTGAVAHLPDISIRGLYEMPHNDTFPPTFLFSILMAAMHLLNRAKMLRDDPLPTPSSFRALAAHDAGTSKSLRMDNPSVYTEIMDAANCLYAKLPPSSKIETLSSTPWTNFDVPMLVSFFPVPRDPQLIPSSYASSAFGSISMIPRETSTTDQPVSQLPKKHRP